MPSQSAEAADVLGRIVILKASAQAQWKENEGCPGWVLLGAAAAVALSLAWWLCTRRPEGAPPGPGLNLPIVGHHLQLMDKDPMPKLREWRAQYGDVFSLYAGQRLVVVLCGYDAIREMLMRPEAFCDRPSRTANLVHHMVESKGLVYSSGPQWRAMRQSMEHIFREFLMREDVWGDKIQEEVMMYIKTINNNCRRGQAFDMKRMTQISVTNAMCSIVFGERFGYKDPVFIELMDALENLFNVGPVCCACSLLAVTRYIPGDPYRAKQIQEDYLDVYKRILKPLIRARIDSYSDDQVDDFISAFVKQIRNAAPNALYGYINEASIPKAVMNMFAAGAEPVSIALRWALVFLINYPDVQEKCYAEVKEVVGFERYPEASDRSEMTYMEATIMEVLRLADVIPLSAPHATRCETTLSGYRIPQRTYVILNLESVLLDPNVWEKPEVFMPERFILRNGKLFRPAEFIPFSTGRQACIGETLTRLQLFLYLSTMIQHFSFMPPVDGQLPDMEGVVGITHVPKRFTMRAIKRKNPKFAPVAKVSATSQTDCTY